MGRDSGEVVYFSEVMTVSSLNRVTYSTCNSLRCWIGVILDHLLTTSKYLLSNMGTSVDKFFT